LVQVGQKRPEGGLPLVAPQEERWKGALKKRTNERIAPRREGGSRSVKDNIKAAIDETVIKKTRGQKYK